MDQSWFEMSDVRKRSYQNSVWIPLRCSEKVHESGKDGYDGYSEEFFGAGSAAFPLEGRDKSLKLGWMDVGISHNHKGWAEGDSYYPATEFRLYDDSLVGENLVLDQHFNSKDINEWHLSQELVVTLGLKREGDSWVRPDEGYIEVARLKRNEEGSPVSLEIKASHLRDYLAARKMGLYMTTYRSRVEVTGDKSHISWKDDTVTDKKDNDDWEGRLMEIHEGGHRFGEEWSVHHMSRTDVDPEEDVPSMGFPTDDNVESKSWTAKFEGKKLYRIEGELWKNEWIDPAEASPIVRGDKLPAKVHFITDEKGTEETRETLVEGEGRWLWFKPEIVPALLNYRGSTLGWYTAETGHLGCSPDHGVHFGINRLGLINVYAKDIGLLPDWQQKIWSGFNVSPDGKVSKELLDSQVAANPAKTLAPEAYLAEGLRQIEKASVDVFGVSIVRPHEKTEEIIRNAHRFRAKDLDGVFALAKDLARLTADSFDVAQMKKLVKPPKGTNWGSLKYLQGLLATKVTEAQASKIMGPLFKIYDLRLADAHMPSDDAREALKFLGIDEREPYIFQGKMLLDACVTILHIISDALRRK